MTRHRTALVLGASGGIGGEVARRLLARGWHVRALQRSARRAATDDGMEWMQGDAMRKADVIDAAEDASIIVHAVNPPGYRNWGELVLPMLENTIVAAQASGARILLPGTLYNYGSGTQHVIDERTPQQASSRKGLLRVAMEQRLLDASSRGARVLIVRAGDFFGPQPGGSWFSQAMVRPGKPVKVITCPGAPGVGHAWAYLPDLAETMLRLLDQDDRLAPFETFHFRGQWDPDGTRMVEAIRHAVNDTAIPVRRLPWRVLRLFSPFNTLFREMTEISYLWKQPFELDNTRLVQFLGDEPQTPLLAAVHTTLKGLKCIPSDGPLPDADIVTRSDGLHKTRP